tara:strand:+ start:244 stop:510 length:267 start_codon:yes stop_codon:yes gene_type:complete
MPGPNHKRPATCQCGEWEYDEENVDKLRDILYEASRDLRLEWNARMRDVNSASDEELEAADEILKSQSDEKTDEKPAEMWSANDPVNW